MSLINYSLSQKEKKQTPQENTSRSMCCSGKDETNAPTNSVKVRKYNKSEGLVNGSFESKVVILGDSGVGKSSITYRYLQNKFSETQVPTIGGQFQQLKVPLKTGATLKINLWDTAGEEKFRSMLPMYYKDATAAILTYDLGSMESFQNVDYWVRALDDNVRKDDCLLVLVGNKCDLEPELIKVPTEVAQRFAEKNNMMFFEVSAKTGEGVGELFRKLAEELVKKFS